MSDGLDAGTCFINCYNKTDVAAPFGGFKQSGFGKDLGNVFAVFFAKLNDSRMKYQNHKRENFLMCGFNDRSFFI